MAYASYNGKSAPYRGEKVPRRRWVRKDNNGRMTAGRFTLRILLFPALFFYWELVLHLAMGLELKYLPVYLVFSIAAGLFVCALTVPFRWRVNSIISKVISVIMPILYCAEMIAKKILQSYYPLSSLKTAAGNRLGDYSEAIFSTILANIPLILVFFLPTILLFIFGKRHMGYYRFKLLFAALMMTGAFVFHLVGLAVVNLPWSGDLTPSKLYYVDTNIDDKVEQLGVFTMLRLDVKYLISPPKADLGNDFDGLDVLGPSSAAPTPTPSPAGSGDDSPDDPQFSQAPPPVVDTSPNVMDIDLASLSENGKNSDIKWLANYFNSVTPTNKNEYTGMFEGYNVIQIVIEGFSGYVIDPQLTPTLYKLANEGFVFNNYYTALHFTSTSNGECQTLLGLYPKNGFPITMQETGERRTNCYLSLANQLKREGYLVQAYHANYEMYGRFASHSNLGYDYRQYGNGFDNLELKSGGDAILWPQRDSYMIEASVDNFIHSDQPFHVYYLTISGHMPYSDNRVVAPYRETVRALPYTEKTQNYIATAMEADKALKTLLDKLEAAGKLDKTLIIATGDHIPYFDVDTLEELTGRKFGSSEDLQYINESNIDFDVYKNTLILWSAGMEEKVEVNKVCCQVDILPTVSNLLGLEYDSRLLAGSDILSTSEGLVIFSSRCWRSDRGFYNRFTQTFTPAPGVQMTADEQDAYVSAMKKLVSYKLDSTALIVDNDFYKVVFDS